MRMGREKGREVPRQEHLMSAENGKCPSGWSIWCLWWKINLEKAFGVVLGKVQYTRADDLV